MPLLMGHTHMRKTRMGGHPMYLYTGKIALEFSSPPFVSKVLCNRCKLKKRRVNVDFGSLETSDSRKFTHKLPLSFSNGRLATA